MEKISLNDIPQGEIVNVIYWVGKWKPNQQPQAFSYLNDNYCEIADISFGGIKKWLEEKCGEKIYKFIMIADYGLNGFVYRWNAKEGLFRYGTTEGYC